MARHPEGGQADVEDETDLTIHMVNRLVSYAMQIGAPAKFGFLPFEELHAKPDSTPLDLVAGRRSAGNLSWTNGRQARPAGALARVPGRSDHLT
jgi:hypothetical protein